MSSQFIRERQPNTSAVCFYQVTVLENMLFSLKITCLIVSKANEFPGRAQQLPRYDALTEKVKVSHARSHER